MLADVSWLLPWHSLSGNGYQFYSGIGSDISELAIFGAVIGAYRKAECHQEGCHRLGRFPYGHYKLCHVHHPNVPSDGKVRAEHINQVSAAGVTSSPSPSATVPAAGKPKKEGL